MASEYESVRSKILSGATRRMSLPAIATPLKPISPPPTQPSSISLPTPGSMIFDSSAPDCSSFISSLAIHVRTLSETRISQGFLHLHPSPIHDAAEPYLENAFGHYNQLTDLFRRIDVNLFNISTFRLEVFLSLLLTRLIHGSTYLSQSGTDLAATTRICHSIFTGAGITELNLPHTAGYRSELETITEQGRAAEFATVLRGRERVVHHTNALVYFTQNLIENGELTQDLIKETHRILVKDYETVDNKTWEQFGGWYRDYRVVPVSQADDITAAATVEPTQRPAATVPPDRPTSSIYSATTPLEERWLDGFHWQRRESVNPAAVGMYMSKLIYSYHAQLAMDHTEVKDSGENTVSDPFALTAWLVCEFLHIHPFIVGNEEMSRIILSGVLMKELGIVAVLGDEKEPGRLEYLGIMERAKERHQGDVEKVANGGSEEEAYAEFAALIVKKAISCAEEVAAMVGSS
ncbi:hypothetical protein H072_2207 [Dactylellina haptotyla CBS 200.50]|uniref:Fido domain-containing protein n=1 Tax=Dactylellina haptotyla (strain CBS 200.50) TaxID=1284197 RepID=S8BWA6_DACHA|nr:hypothetical protein H072_2207 [Dactylellina haptotyla CBS 200.50]